MLFGDHVESGRVFAPPGTGGRAADVRTGGATGCTASTGAGRRPRAAGNGRCAARHCGGAAEDHTRPGTNGAHGHRLRDAHARAAGIWRYAGLFRLDDREGRVRGGARRVRAGAQTEHAPYVGAQARPDPHDHLFRESRAHRHDARADSRDSLCLPPSETRSRPQNVRR